MPNLPVPGGGSFEDRLKSVQDAISSGAMDPVGANSTTFKPGTGPGDTAKPTPTSPANYLLAAADMSKSGTLPAPAQRSIPAGMTTDPLSAKKPSRNIRVVK